MSNEAWVVVGLSGLPRSHSAGLSFWPTKPLTFLCHNAVNHFSANKIKSQFQQIIQNRHSFCLKIFKDLIYRRCERRMIFAQCFKRSSSLSLARPSPNAWFGAPRMLAINVQKDDIRICPIGIWDLSVSFFLMEWIQEIDGDRASAWFDGYFWRGPCGEHVLLFHVRCCNLLQFRLIFQDYQIARFSTAAIDVQQRWWPKVYWVRIKGTTDGSSTPWAFAIITVYNIYIC